MLATNTTGGILNHSSITPIGLATANRADEASSTWEFSTWLTHTVGQASLAGSDSTELQLRLDPPHLRLTPRLLCWSTAVGMAMEQLQPTALLDSESPAQDLEVVRSQTSQKLREGNSKIDSASVLNERYRRMIAEAAHDVRSPIATASQLISTVAQRARGLGSVTQAELSLLDIANQRLAQASSWAAGILMDRRLEQLSAISIRKRFYPLQWRNLMQPMLQSIANDHNVRLLWIGWERSLPRLYLDVNHLSRVLLNLVTNAIHASTVGDQITIRVGCIGDFTKRLAIHVEDQGRGLSEDQLLNINSQYRSAEAVAGSKKSRGPGIGLATCKALVDSLGGSLSARPLQAGGTQFTLSLPVDDLQLAIRSWLIRALANRNVRSDAMANCSVFGIRAMSHLHTTQADQNLQLMADNFEHIYRVDRDRWLCFTMNEKGTATKLQELERESLEVDPQGALRFVPIVSQSPLLRAAGESEADVLKRIPKLVEQLVAQATLDIKDAIPVVDDLETTFGSVYSENLLRDTGQGHHRRQDSADSSLQSPRAYDRNPGAIHFSPQQRQHAAHELDSLARGWRRTQQRLDRVHRSSK